MERFNLVVIANNGVRYTPSNFEAGFTCKETAIKEANVLGVKLYGANDTNKMTGKVIVLDKNNNIVTL